jgi:hypothetical protein
MKLKTFTLFSISFFFTVQILASERLITCHSLTKTPGVDSPVIQIKISDKPSESPQSDSISGEIVVLKDSIGDQVSNIVKGSYAAEYNKEFDVLVSILPSDDPGISGRQLTVFMGKKYAWLEFQTQNIEGDKQIHESITLKCEE